MRAVPRWLTAGCLLAGSVDAATGALLIAAPGFALGLMGVSVLPTEPIYIRFIGAFVAGVGLAYGLPFLHRRGRMPRLVAMLEVTTLVRFSVGAFVVAAIARDALGGAWSVVAATDLSLAAVQLAILRTVADPGQSAEQPS